MTQQEFTDWTNFTKGSTYHWVSDQIRESCGEYLFYIGGENGRFILIDKTGKLQAGTYEGAIPHIGEAEFITTFTKQFESKDKALARVFECGGIKFLLDFMGFKVYTA